MCGYSTFCLSICQLMGIWLLPLSYYEQCCHEHLCISFRMDVCFSPLEYIIRSTAAGSYNNSVFNILRNYFPKCLYHFYPPGSREGSSFNTSLILLFSASNLFEASQAKMFQEFPGTLRSTRGSNALFSLRLPGKISSGKPSPSVCWQPLPPTSPAPLLVLLPHFPPQ